MKHECDSLGTRYRGDGFSVLINRFCSVCHKDRPVDRVKESEETLHFQYEERHESD